MDDKLTRDDIVDELRGYADLLDRNDESPRRLADETRRLARRVEQGGRQTPVRTDGSGVLGRAGSFGAAGITLTERAMGNLALVLTAVLWMAAGHNGLFSVAGWACLLGGVVSLAVGNALKRWSA